MTKLKDVRDFAEKLQRSTKCSVCIGMSVWSWSHDDGPEVKWELSFVSQIPGSKAQIFYFKTVKDLISWASQPFNVNFVNDIFEGRITDVSENAKIVLNSNG